MQLRNAFCYCGTSSKGHFLPSISFARRERVLLICCRARNDAGKRMGRKTALRNVTWRDVTCGDAKYTSSQATGDLFLENGAECVKNENVTTA